MTRETWVSFSDAGAHPKPGWLSGLGSSDWAGGNQVSNLADNGDLNETSGPICMGSGELCAAPQSGDTNMETKICTLKVPSWRVEVWSVPADAPLMLVHVGS